MTHEERVKAMMQWGYGRPQSDFLVKAALGSGYFVSRQASKFPDKFTAKLLKNDHAAEIQLSKGKLYHLYRAAMYEVLGDRDNRHRREHSPALRKARVIGLDFILGNSQMEALLTMQEQVDAMTARGIRLEELPSAQYKTRGSENVANRYFVDRHPILIDRSGDVVLAYIDEGSRTVSGFETWVTKHASLLSRLPSGHVVYVCCRPDLLTLVERVFYRHIAVLRTQDISPSTQDFLRYIRIENAKQKGQTLPFADLKYLRDVTPFYTDDRHRKAAALWATEGIPGVVDSLGDDPFRIRFSKMFMPFSYDALGTIFSRPRHLLKRGLSRHQTGSVVVSEAPGWSSEVPDKSTSLEESGIEMVQFDISEGW